MIQRREGFTLLEILIAIMIMAVATTGIFAVFGSGQAASRRAADLTRATLLAREKMATMTLDMEKRITEGRFPQDAEHEEGSFDAPYDQFKWTVDVRKVELPIPPIQDEKAGLMQVFMQTLSKQIAEAVREITVTIIWSVRDQERKLVVTTHIVNI